MFAFNSLPIEIDILEITFLSFYRFQICIPFSLLDQFRSSYNFYQKFLTRKLFYLGRCEKMKTETSPSFQYIRLEQLIKRCLLARVPLLLNRDGLDQPKVSLGEPLHSQSAINCKDRHRCDR